MKKVYHELKTLPEYFKAVIEGRKLFELRENDRDFKVRDIVILQEWDGEYTGREAIFHVPYILDTKGDYGLDEDYRIFTIEPLNWVNMVSLETLKTYMEEIGFNIRSFSDVLDQARWNDDFLTLIPKSKEWSDSEQRMRQILEAIHVLKEVSEEDLKTELIKNELERSWFKGRKDVRRVDEK